LRLTAPKEKTSQNSLKKSPQYFISSETLLIPLRKKEQPCRGASKSMKKIYLEFFRGVSSVFILFWHIIFLAPTGRPTRFTAYWGTDALMMFFMLSGIVINLTESKKPRSSGEFLANRFIRIYPLFAAGVFLAFLALIVTHSQIPSPKVIAGNFLLVSTMKDYMGYIVPSIQSNLPVWSLSFECAFYVLFALTIGRNQKKALSCWFIMSLIALPLYYLKVDRTVETHVIAIFAFSSIWLLGYYTYQYRDYFYADKYAALFSLGIMPLISRMHFISNFYDPGKYLFLSLFAIPFFRYSLQLPPAGKKIKMSWLVIPHLLIVFAALNIRYMPLKDMIAYSTLPYVYIGVGYLLSTSKVKTHVISFISKTGAILGKYSYALYITHFTILFTFSKLFHTVWAFTLVSLPIIAFVAYGLENWLQPVVVKYFKRQKKAPETRKEYDFNFNPPPGSFGGI
jgi:peptidoglycan/LPS O-acetylase OafA/YrhL